MVKIKLASFVRARSSPGQQQEKPTLNASYTPIYSPTHNVSNITSLSGAKLWDNDELVLMALKVYGKYPRPQCFNEISRVCKLSNLRKSRYFHEKMMKNNPYEDKMRQLIADEGEEAYPFFKIFFEEYKTKKERQKLIGYEEDKQSLSVSNDNSVLVDNSPEVFDNDQYNEDVMEYSNDMDNESEQLESINQQVVNNSQVFYADQIAPLASSSAQYLENLELKLKILTEEKETMVDYFRIFGNVIESLQIEIGRVKKSEENEEEEELDMIGKDASVSELMGKFDLMTGAVERLDKEVLGFEREQARLKEDLKVTTSYVHVENRRLKEALNSCRAKLYVKEELGEGLKRRLEDSVNQRRVTVARHLSVQAKGNATRQKFVELKENFDRLYSQIQSL